MSSGYTKGTVVDVSLKEYLGWSKTRKQYYSLFYAPVELPFQPVKVDPYIYGSWLGDGTRIRAELTTPAGPMLDAWYAYWGALGHTFYTVEKTGCFTAKVTGAGFESKRGFQSRGIWQHQWFRESVIAGEKRIRLEYLNNSRAVRLALLAGLIDSDGHAVNGGYAVTTKWAGLARDIGQLAESLGFPVRRAVYKHTIKSRGFSGDYHRVRILAGTDSIPTREKTTTERSRGRCFGRATAQFNVTPLGVGRYAGFSLDGNHRFLLANGIVTHNSFGMGVRLFLEWIRDPEWTSVRVIGPSGDHLEANLFSHMVRLHKTASLPMPGEVGELFIGLSRRDQLSAIKGVIVPIGTNKKAGRIQGAKRQPRGTPHPIFGPLSRLFIFIDEIENVPAGIWFDMDNVLSQVTKEGYPGGFKIFGAYNPSDLSAQVAKRAEPDFGWAAFDIDTHFRWKSLRGWDVLRLDGEKSENVIEGRERFPGLQTRAGLEVIAQNAGGTGSPGYYTMGRGAYPAQGIELALVPPGLYAKMVGEFIWLDTPVAAAGCDIALEGRANAVYSLGRFGKASGMKLPPSLEFPKGRMVMFKDASNQPITRYALQLDKQFTLPKGDTVAMARQIIDTNRRAGVRPEFFCCDRTGAGNGVADLVKNDWSAAIHDINYSEGPTDSKIMAEDSRTCREEFDRIWTELWYALRALGEFGYFLIAPGADQEKLQPQITRRKSKMVGKCRRIESKKDYVARGHESPDEADSATLFVHAVRRGTSWSFTMKGDRDSGVSGDLTDDDDWNTARLGPGGVYIDSTNRTDSLEEHDVSIL